MRRVDVQAIASPRRRAHGHAQGVMTCLCDRLRQRAQAGFTLIEVLVALAIVAIALAAALRATGVLAQNNRGLRDRTLATLSAENAAAQLRLDTAMPDPGSVRTVPCYQGKLAMRCTLEFRKSVNNNFRQVEIRVYAADDDIATLATLSTLVTRLP